MATSSSPHLWAVVLAGGAGRRFGGRKLLYPYEGRPLLHHALEAAFAAPVRGVIVVTGCDGEAVTRVAGDFAAGRPAPLRIVHAAEWEEGLSASLRAGFHSLPAKTEGAFVFLGDMPAVPKAILQPLADALVKGATAAVPACQGRFGHPVLIASRLFPSIQQLSGDRGARSLLDSLGVGLATCETSDAGILRDIDTRQDLRDS